MVAALDSDGTGPTGGWSDDPGGEGGTRSIGPPAGGRTGAGLSMAIVDARGRLRYSFAGSVSNETVAQMIQVISELRREAACGLAQPPPR